MREAQRGFTIVELLIVVVVIAILAAITIVGYTGITQRAEESRFFAAVDSYEKALRLYQAQYGEYPSTDTRPDILYMACLGDDYPATGDLAEGACAASASANGSVTFAKSNTNVNDALREVIAKLPDIGSATLTITEGTVSSHTRGILYDTVLYPSPRLIYFVPLDRPCGRGEKITDASGLIARCQILLE